MAQTRWLGHSTFIVTTRNGKTILVDPFLDGNPTTPAEWKSPDQLDVILVTHGHDDHAADTLTLAEKTGAKVVTIVELSHLFQEDGLSGDQAVEMNKGGTVDFGDFRVTMTNANHSSSWKGRYAGDPAGFILHIDDLVIYHAGDTNIMPDFELYGTIYQPDIAILPIGDHYTMGPLEAAHACRMLKAKYAVPMHYGTMPVLSGTPDEFQKLVEELTGKQTRVLVPAAGENFLESLDL
ncbi:metal-dependent hydrolase [Balneolales bacterium ANBcel1]|nr:metal-dependent hydrolase [Balneolales bacterium ANBcel1]